MTWVARRGWSRTDAALCAHLSMVATIFSIPATMDLDPAGISACHDMMMVSFDLHTATHVFDAFLSPSIMLIKLSTSGGALASA